MLQASSSVVSGTVARTSPPDVTFRFVFRLVFHGLQPTPVLKSASSPVEAIMPDTLVGQAPATGSTTGRVLKTPTQPEVKYDGQNAGVQQPRSVQSLAAAVAVRRGANWFYWIAGLSLVNTIVVLTGGNFHFVLGLGITGVTDAFRSPQARMVGYFIDLLVLGFFLMCGYMAGKLHKWAFVMGMGFYALDAALTAMAQDWISFAFHVYVLVCIWRGFSHVSAAREPAQVAVLSGK